MLVDEESKEESDEQIGIEEKVVGTLMILQKLEVVARPQTQ